MSEGGGETGFVREEGDHWISQRPRKGDRGGELGDGGRGDERYVGGARIVCVYIPNEVRRVLYPTNAKPVTSSRPSIVILTPILSLIVPGGSYSIWFAAHVQGRGGESPVLLLSPVPITAHHVVERGVCKR